MIRERFDALMCDLDGVLYRGDRPIPGAARAIDDLRTAGVRVVFATNNSRSTVDQYIERLGAIGVSSDRHDIVTSAGVTADVLAARGAAGKKAFVVGGDGLRSALDAVGIEVSVGLDGANADLVVVGWDPAFTYDAMRTATAAVLGGAVFIATNDDPSFPAVDALWPGAGAILASIERACGRPAEVMGKPHAPMLDAIAARFGDAHSPAAIGDRPATDLVGARGRGWYTILVLTGVTDRSAASALDPQPDLILGSIAELPSLAQY